MATRASGARPTTNSRVDEGIIQSSISVDEAEKALEAIFAPKGPLGESTKKESFTDSQFLRISRLLELSEKHQWSLRPRTYALLHMINRLDFMSSFVSEGLYDISIPHSMKTIPVALQHSSAILKFLELQPLVLSRQAVDIESNEGRHRHFAEDADVHFRRIKSHGSGGFGEVDHVLSRLSMNEYARRRIHRGRTFKKDKIAMLDFERELATLKRLSHRHLIKYVGSYTDPKYVGLIMAPVADSSLSQYLQVNPFPADRITCLRHFYGCLTSALLYLHESKIRHKDIKPGNILVHGENVLLADFGISLDWTNQVESTTFSRPSALSVAYCSPEVFALEPRNPSSDIYSLGCVFLEMSTVLRGESLDNMSSFFSTHGTKGRYIRTNLEAFQLWVERVRDRPGLEYDNEPLDWIAKMVKFEPGARPSATDVINYISSSEGEFLGPCCRKEDDESSYEGSIIETPGETRESEIHGQTTLKDDTDKDSVIIKAGGDQITKQIESAVQPHKDHATETNVMAESTKVHLAKQREGEQLLPSTRNKLNLPTVTLSGNVQEKSNEEEKLCQLLRKSGFDVKEKNLNKVEALHWASIKGSESTVRLLLENGVQVNAKSPSGTALHLAVDNGHEAVVRQLLENGADMDAKTGEGTTALYSASLQGHELIVQLLLEKGADVVARRNNGWTALHAAADNGHTAVMKLLLHHGANVMARRNSDWTPLHNAAYEGRQEAVQLLIMNSANVNAVMENGWTALQLAARRGHESVVRTLLEKGAEIDAKMNTGVSALSSAVSEGHESIVRVLIENGAEVDIKTNSGATPLYFAALKGDEAVLQLLLQAGADVLVRASDGRTTLMAAAESGSTAALQLFLDLGVEINAKMQGGWTALHLAAANKYEAALKFLLEKGADIEARTEEGMTPLYSAALNGHEEVANMLLKRGANTGAKKNDGWTPLFVAAYEGRNTVVKCLLDHGANVMELMTDGWTALHAAATRSNNAGVKLLLEKSADIEARTKTGSTALYFAALKGSEAIVQLLLESGADVMAKKGGGLTALHAAAEKGHVSVMRLLLDHGAEVTASGDTQWTPLHKAADGGYEAAVQLLLERGAKTEAETDKGETALFCATNKGHEAVVKLLLQNRAYGSATNAEHSSAVT